jgi:hypothetical protein
MATLRFPVTYGSESDHKAEMANLLTKSEKQMRSCHKVIQMTNAIIFDSKAFLLRTRRSPMGNRALGSLRNFDVTQFQSGIA